MMLFCQLYQIILAHSSECIQKIQTSDIEYHTIKMTTATTITKTTNTNTKTIEPKLLQDYAHSLQSENTAKTLEIKILREQLDKYSTATLVNPSSVTIAPTTTTTTTAITAAGGSPITDKSVTNLINSTSTNPFSARYRFGAGTTTTTVTQSSTTKCANCAAKDTQIATLNAHIKQLQKQEAELRRVRTVTNTSTTSSIQYEKLQKMYDQLRIKYEYDRKIQWSSFKVDAHPQADEWRQQTLKLRAENVNLISKVQFLQRRLQSIEQANRVLRDEVVTYVQNKNTTHVQSALPIQTVLTQVVNTPTITIPPVTTNVKYLPSAKSVSFQLPATEGVAEQVNGYVTQKYHSGYAPCSHSHSSYSYSHPQMRSHTYLRSQSPNFPQPSSVHYTYEYLPASHYHLSPLTVLGTENNGNISGEIDGEYYKDIVSQRWRSLQHKIKILQQENGKLRGEVGSRVGRF